MLNKFRKWWHGAVQGLGVLCLWYEFARAFDVYLGARDFGIILGMLIIGWGITYEEKPKQKQESLDFKGIFDAYDELKKRDEDKKD